jgi:hypothetical protein
MTKLEQSTFLRYLWTQMRIFHPENSLVVSRNLWLILLSRIFLCVKFNQLYITKNYEIPRIQNIYLSLGVVVGAVLAIL